MKNSFSKRVSKSDFSIRNIKNFLNKINQVNVLKNDRFDTINKRKNKSVKTKSEIDKFDLLFREINDTMFLKIIKIEKKFEKIVQYENIMTKKKRFVFFEKRYDIDENFKNDKKFKQLWAICSFVFKTWTYDK